MKFKQDTLIHHLKPAGFFFLEKSGVIRTVLGSCVTVTMYCRRTGTASACHPVLPACRENKVCYFAGCRNKYKYVECVIPEMARLFRKAGIRMEELEVKLFGGSEMITKNNSQSQVIQVGRMNAEMAMKKFTTLDIKLKSYDIGGSVGRRLYFDTSTGDVWVKKLTGNAATLFEKKDIQKQTLLQREG